MEQEKKPFFPKVKWTKKLFFDSYFWLFLVMFILDIVSKWAVGLNLEIGQEVALIPNFLYVTHIYNKGAVFGVGDGTWWARAIFIAVSWIMSVVIFIYYRKNILTNGKLMNATLMLIFAGAVGNLIDRTFYWGQNGAPDGVIDWIEFYLGGGPGKGSSFWNPFAIFNWADACITVGIIMLIVILLVESNKKDKDDEDDLSQDPRLKEKDDAK
jgi:signal peptidase II